MANAITLRKTYSTLLDEAYKLASLTVVLDGPNDLAQEGANANEIIIPKILLTDKSQALSASSGDKSFTCFASPFSPAPRNQA